MFSAEAVLTMRINHLGVVLGLQIAHHRAMRGSSAQIGTNARIYVFLLYIVGVKTISAALFNSSLLTIEKIGSRLKQALEVFVA